MYAFFKQTDSSETSSQFIPLPKNYHKITDSSIIIAGFTGIHLPTPEAYEQYMEQRPNRIMEFIKQHELNDDLSYLRYYGEDLTNESIVCDGEITELGLSIVESVKQFINNQFSEYSFEEYMQMAISSVNKYIDRPVQKLWIYLSMHGMSSYSSCGWGKSGENLYYNSVHAPYGVSFNHLGEKYRAALTPDGVKIYQYGALTEQVGNKLSHWHLLDEAWVNENLGLYTDAVLGLDDSDFVYYPPETDTAKEVLLKTIDDARARVFEFGNNADSVCLGQV